MALEILIENQKLDVGGVSLNFTFNNPLFDEKNTDRSYTYSFTLLATPNNKRLLKHAERLDTSVVSDEFDCNIIVNGSLFLKGVLLIKKRTNESYKCYWTNESTQAIKKLADTKINELAYEPFHLATPEINWIFRYYQRYTNAVSGLGKRKFSITINQKDYSFDIDAPDTISSAFTTLKDSINADFPGMASYGETQYIINHPASGSDPAWTEYKETHIFIINHLTPIKEILIENFVWFHDGSGVAGTPISTHHLTVLEEYVEASNPLYVGIGLPDTKAYNWSGAWTDITSKISSFDADIKSNPYSKNFCLPVIKNQGFYKDDNPDFKGYVNYYPYVFQSTQLVEKEFTNNFSPQVFLTTVLDALEKETGVEINRAQIHEEVNKIIFYNNVSLDENYDSILPPTDFMEPKIVISPALKRLNLTKEYIYPEEYLPPITAEELLNALGDILNKKFFSKEGKIYFKDVVAVLNTKYENWTKKAENEYDFEFLNTKGYSLNYERDESDTLHDTAQLDGYLYKEGEMGVSPAITTTKSAAEQDDVDPERAWRIPVVNQEGVSSAMKQNGSSKPKFLIYHGHQPDTLGDDYPMASNHYLDVTGNRLGDLSLLIQGKEGLFETRWKKWLEFMAESKLVTKVVRLASHEVNELVKWENPIKEIYHNKGTVKGIVKSVQFKASEAGISPVKIEIASEGIGKIPVVVQSEEPIVVPPLPSVTILIPGDNAPWKDVIGLLSTSLGSLTRSNNSVSWGNMAAFSSIPAGKDGFIEFTLANMAGYTTGIMMGGLSLSSNGSNYNDIEFKFYYEGQYSRMSVFNGGRVGTVNSVSLSDVWKIERTISGGVGVIVFYRNNSVFYTHPTNSVLELHGKFDIYRYMTINDIKIEY